MTHGTDFEHLSADELEEIAARAWHNVAAHSVEYSPLSILASLTDVTGLPTAQFDYLAGVYFLRSREVRALLDAARRIVTRLSQTTRLEATEGRAPVDYIDWPSTVLRRVTGRADPTHFVLRRSELHRDLPENRLLRFALTEVVRLANAVLAGRPIEGWRTQMAAIRAEASSLADHPLLRSIPAESNRQGVLAARASRISGYREVATAVSLFRGLFGPGDRALLLDLFRQSVLVPELEERAFELLVLFRLIDYLETLGARRVAIRLIGSGAGPVFVFELGGRRFSVYFQNASPVLGDRSIYRRIVAAAHLGSAGRRPDVVIQINSADAETRFMVVEAKCSANADTIRDGIFQLVGYFGDFGLYQEQDPIVLLVSYAGLSQNSPGPIRISSPQLTAYVVDVTRLSQSFAVLPLT